MKTNLLTDFCLMKSLLLISSLAINTFYFAQNKVYANQQISTNAGLVCAGCMVVNPNGAVGSNEDDYSLLKTDIGLLSGVEQILHFPTPNKANNMVIGLGTDDNFPMENYLDVQLLTQVTVELYYESGNYQSEKVAYNLNKDSFKIHPQKPDRGSIAIPVGMSGPVPVYYNRAKISIRGLIGIVNKLRIYYGYYKEISKCNPPANAIHYYPFDEHTADLSGSKQSFSLVTANNRNVVYKDSMVCKQGLSYQLPKDSTYTLQSYGSSSLPMPQPKSPRMVSFWARVDQGGSIDLTIYGEKIKISQDSIIIRPVNENHNFNKIIGKMSRPNPVPSAGSLNFYILDFNNDPTPAYKGNIDPFGPPIYPVDFCLSVNGVASLREFPNLPPEYGYPLTTNCTHWAAYYTGKYDDTFSIKLNKAQMDEFLIYDKKFTYYLFAGAFYKQADNNETFSMLRDLASVENDVLSLFPNPTTGSITLDGNILLLDSEISVRNISGKEVYRTKFSSKTFELPASLSAGIYMLSVQTKDKKIYTRKIILTR